MEPTCWRCKGPLTSPSFTITVHKEHDGRSTLVTGVTVCLNCHIEVGRTLGTHGGMDPAPLSFKDEDDTDMATAFLKLLYDASLKAKVSAGQLSVRTGVEGLGGAMISFNLPNGKILSVTTSIGVNMGVFHDVLKYKKALEKIRDYVEDIGSPPLDTLFQEIAKEALDPATTISTGNANQQPGSSLA